MLTILAVALGAAVLAAYVATAVVRRIGRAPDGTPRRRLSRELVAPVALVAFVAVFWGVASSAPVPAAARSTGFVVLVVAVTFLADRTVGGLAEWYLLAVARNADTVLHNELIPLARQLLRVLAVFVAGIVVLGYFHVNVTGLLATAGVASLAFALAAQDTLGNLFAGFIILVDRPFRVGDRVEFGGLIGDVAEIGLRSTRILTFDRNLVVVPNRNITAAQVTNRAYPNNIMALKVDVGVGYGTDIPKAKQIMLDIAGACPDVLADPVPAVFFTGFGDSSLALQMWCYVGEYRRLFATLDALNTAILDAFRRAEIEIPFPQRVVTMVPGADEQRPDPEPAGSPQPSA